MLYRITLIYIVFIQIVLAHSLPLVTPKSKKETEMAALVIHSVSPYTFFCEYPFSTTGTVITQDCPTCPDVEAKIKWFYIVPPEAFAKHLLCYQEKLCVNGKGKWHKGQTCCEKKSPIYRMMSRDLFNIVPEAPQMAKLRRRYKLAPLEGDAKGCSLKLDKKLKTLYIDPNLMGFISRTYLYMADTYSFDISEVERKEYLAWHHTYPPSRWEILRNQKIKSIQGNENLYISFSTPDIAKHHSRYPPNP